MPTPPMRLRPPREDEEQFALWRLKRSTSAVDTPSVVVAHADIPVGESIALLLRLKGYVAVATSALENLELMLEHWKPRALLIDTRLCRADNFRFIRRTTQDDTLRSVLILAVTHVYPEETAHDMKRIGFDGLCRRPWPVWQLADMLEGHFHTVPDLSKVA
ncbi:MAG: response regulator receiver protein [Paraburkholderia sp.]|uniref:response regulator receiver protein n=1 Tax=Paraburkholderia sp. TaxID=1926495 RepID=UPI003C4854D5